MFMLNIMVAQVPIPCYCLEHDQDGPDINWVAEISLN